MSSALLVGIVGLFIGSFLNATALRYDPERFVFAPNMHGRSRCPHCKRALRWHELVPLLSFFLQRGKCKACHARLSLQYPLAELATGAAFFAVMWRLFLYPFGGQPIEPHIIVLWLVAAACIVLVGLIDLRARIIPDEMVIALGVLGIVLGVFGGNGFQAVPTSSFLGSYALIFGFQESAWLGRLVAALFGGAFFGVLASVTRGRGVGLGDLKLAVALGVLFGWPDIVLMVMLSFVLGTVFLLPLLIRGALGMKGTVPFGPFLAVAAFVVLLWGHTLLRGYFALFGIA